MFDVAEHLDELRRRPTEWLVARRDEAVREQRRWRVEELTVTRVLDERGAFDDTVAARDGVSCRSVRETVETARALESLPAVAAAAHAGELSAEQLGSVCTLADPASDADLDGGRFQAAIEHLTEQMRAAKGQPWDSFAHRAAAALVTVATNYESVECDGPTRAPRTLLQVSVPRTGRATIAGIPLPDAMVEALRADAVVEPVLVDESGAPVTVGRRSTARSPKVARAVLLRDGHCRRPGCEHRHHLEVHHLIPRSWGGRDDPANLAAVCTRCHATLAPHGRWMLVGNPNLPHGLQLVTIEQWQATNRRAGP
jgi:hypothetical protein